MERGLGEDDVLPIDLLMVSHIDDDHIRGVLELIDELIEAREMGMPDPYRIQNIWHNSFDDIIGTSPDELQASITQAYGTASSAEAVRALSPTLSFDAASILASINQGRKLRDAIAKLQLPHNVPFHGLVMLNQPAQIKVPFQGSLDVTVIGPRQKQLLDLQKAHDKWLTENERKRNDREAALAAFSDPSVPNLSSIVVQVQHQGSTVLLTGDARGDYILEGLIAAGLLAPGGHCHMNILKVPHHGSDNNVTQDFFHRVQADHYVFSGDGQHGNPERETMKMLFQARTGNAELQQTAFKIYFTYSIAEIDANRKIDWNREFAKGRKTRHWDDARDSLGAFFSTSIGQLDVQIITDQDRVRIEL